jgi:AmiR/NasT family two-component response regulator
VALIERLIGQIDQLADRTAQLHIALDSRVAIEQAKGVLAERRGITIAEAFDLLRSTARSRRMQLHALAETVVASAGRPDADDDLR